MRHCPICFGMFPATKRLDCQFDTDACRNEYRRIEKRAARFGWSTDDYPFATKYMREPLSKKQLIIVLTIGPCDLGGVPVVSDITSTRLKGIQK